VYLSSSLNFLKIFASSRFARFSVSSSFFSSSWVARKSTILRSWWSVMRARTRNLDQAVHERRCGRRRYGHVARDVLHPDGTFLEDVFQRNELQNDRVVTIFAACKCLCSERFVMKKEVDQMSEAAGGVILICDSLIVRQFQNISPFA